MLSHLKTSIVFTHLWSYPSRMIHFSFFLKTKFCICHVDSCYQFIIGHTVNLRKEIFIHKLSENKINLYFLVNCRILHPIYIYILDSGQLIGNEVFFTFLIRNYERNKLLCSRFRLKVNTKTNEITQSHFIEVAGYFENIGKSKQN